METLGSRPSPWRVPSPLPDRFETKRIVLRYWQPEDAKAMLDAIGVDRASYLPWTPVFASDNRTVEECEKSVERFRSTREGDDPRDFVLGLFDRQSGEAVGGTGLHRIAPETLQAEVGYWIRSDRRRQGLCSEAVEGLIDWSFRPQSDGGWGFRRIEIVCAAGNLPSQTVPRKLGMRQEARLSKHRFVDGVGWDDTLVFAVLANEWRTR